VHAASAKASRPLLTPAAGAAPKPAATTKPAAVSKPASGTRVASKPAGTSRTTSIVETAADGEENEEDGSTLDDMEESTEGCQDDE
jgi:hypothetical protein